MRNKKGYIQKKNINKSNDKNNKDNSDEIILRYEIKDINDSIRIFGDKFVKKNKKLCKIIINGKEFDLKTNINKNQLNNDILEIKLKGIKKITNMSHMFHRCDRLKSLPDISKWNTQNVIDMSYMFYKCKSLVSLPDISKWDTQNVKDMRIYV